MSALTRSDLAIVCRELGQALLRIGQQLGAPDRLGAPPEPLPKPAADPRRQQAKPAAAAEPAPSVPAKQAAPAGAPLKRDPQRASASQRKLAASKTSQSLLALARGGPVTKESAAARLGLSPMSVYNMLRALYAMGELDLLPDSHPQQYVLPGSVPAVEPAAPPVATSRPEAPIASDLASYEPAAPQRRPVDDGERPAPRPQDRPCLRCGKTFRSEGAHNRLCGNCGDYAASQAEANDHDTGRRV